MKFSVRFDNKRRTPLKIVEWILSSLAMIGGLYVMSPLLNYSTVMNGAGALAQTIAHPVGIFIYGLIFFVSGAILAVGLVRNKKQLRVIGLVSTTICRIYSLIGTWLTIGFLPSTWLNSLGIILVSVVIYFVIKWEQKNGSSA